jgi:hypothetical protein
MYFVKYIYSKLDYNFSVYEKMFIAEDFFLFFQHFILHNFLSHIASDKLDPHAKAVLLKLCSLYGAYSLEKHLVTLYQGKYSMAVELPLMGNLRLDWISLIQ